MSLSQDCQHVKLDGTVAGMFLPTQPSHSHAKQWWCLNLRVQGFQGRGGTVRTHTHPCIRSSQMLQIVSPCDVMLLKFMITYFNIQICPACNVPLHYKLSIISLRCLSPTLHMGCQSSADQVPRASCSAEEACTQVL